MITRLLKAPSQPLTEQQIASLQFPVLASIKIDGIRCALHPARGPVSQKFLPIPNHYIRHVLTESGLSFLDGELAVPGFSFNDNQSVIMSRFHLSQSKFKYYVFDHFADESAAYTSRLRVAKAAVSVEPQPEIECLNHVLITSREELQNYEEKVVSEGNEGVMIRSLTGHYKSGRSTLREGLLLKVVRHQRDEATIVGFEEQQENCNAATRDELGLTKRSHSLLQKRGKNTLGAFICNWHGHTLRIGTGVGLTDICRKAIWSNRSAFLGSIITFKSKPFGQKDVPRTPIFVGFRED